MRRSLPVLLAAGLAAACVQPPDDEPPSGWVDLTPGAGVTVAFDDPEGLLSDVVMVIPPVAVTRPTAIRLSVPATTQPVLFQAGMQLHTPVIQVEPYNEIFARPVTLQVPWYPFAETAQALNVRAWTSTGLHGIPRGNWAVTDQVDVKLPTQVTFSLTDGGLYWAGTWEEDPSRTPDEVSDEPCIETDSRLDQCTADADCAVRGCLGEVCGRLPIAPTACRPSLVSQVRHGCACRCGAELCQWVR